jgi:uncharacterized protein HemY
MVTLFRIFAGAGTVLLGAALIIAPIAAFGDRMTIVSGLGIAGMVLLLLAWLLRRFTRPPAQTDDPRHPT